MFRALIFSGGDEGLEIFFQASSIEEVKKEVESICYESGVEAKYMVGETTEKCLKDKIRTRQITPLGQYKVKN